MKNFRPSPSVPIIGVHVDLKGMNFKPSYIPQYLADLAGQGINTVLIEYEDIFPFRGLEIAHDPAVRWSQIVLTRFLSAARQHGIQVIPLQQCFGHLEYILGWKRYRHLAEDRDYPSTIRIEDESAWGLVEDMLRQVITAHPDSKYVHLGMDEALALRKAAKRLGKEPLTLFLEHLARLLPIVEAANKTPMIWTDMLEEHFSLEAFEQFRGRVVFVPWYYFHVNELTPLAQLGGGRRVSRRWLEHPVHPDAPPIRPETQFVEDLNPKLKRVLSPYRRGQMFTPLFQIDMWTKLGMPVVGASALRFTFNGSVLPLYNKQISNVQGWSKAVRRTRQLGQIGTSWARATSWAPPNLCIDLQWPIVTEMARSMGAKPRPFWPGIPAATVKRIIATLGRCREDWRIEGVVAAEMDRLAPRLTAHRYEWESIALMARAMELQRRTEKNLGDVENYSADNRLVDSEWSRRLRDQKSTLRDIARMRRQIRAHFSQRYHGAAFAEWIRHLFDVQEQRLRACQKTSRAKLRLARLKYAR